MKYSVFWCCCFFYWRPFNRFRSFGSESNSLNTIHFIFFPSFLTKRSIEWRHWVQHRHPSQPFPYRYRLMKQPFKKQDNSKLYYLQRRNHQARTFSIILSIILTKKNPGFCSKFYTGTLFKELFRTFWEDFFKCGFDLSTLDNLDGFSTPHVFHSRTFCIQIKNDMGARKNYLSPRNPSHN